MTVSTTMPMPGCAVAAAGAPAPRIAADTPAREVLHRFVDLLYRRRQARAAFESCVVSRGFVDHGSGAFGSRALAMAQLGDSLGGDEVVIDVLHVVFERDVGAVHLQVQRPGEAPRRRVDLFRVAEGRIVEHWEVAA